MRFRKTLEVLWRRLPREQIGVRAAALTYVSVFSLVPLLAVAVLLMQGWHRRALQVRLQSFVREVLAPGIREQSVAYLDRYIHATSANAFGIIGLFTLLLSAASLFRNIDGAINEIWRVQRKRSVGAQILFFGFLAVVGPLVLGLSIAGSASIRQILIGSGFPLARPLITVAAIAAPIAALALLYWIAPNTAVRFRAAAVGGAAAGVLWVLAKNGYGAFTKIVIRYNPVYGSLGVLPLSLIWLYLSWVLVLFGAHLAYSVQVAFSEGAKVRSFCIGPASELAAAIAQQIALAQLRGKKGVTLAELVQFTGVHGSPIQQVLKYLQRDRLVIRGGPDLYRSALELDQLNLAQVVRSMADLEADFTADNVHQPTEIRAIFSKTEQSAWDALSRTTWRDLARDSARKA